MRKLTGVEWHAEGEKRFGKDYTRWKFICPVCGHVASTRDWANAGAPEGAVAFSCVGRWIPGSKQTFNDTEVGPCNYAGGGLFRINPVSVVRENGEVRQVFEFADTVESTNTE